MKVSNKIIEDWAYRNDVTHLCKCPTPDSLRAAFEDAVASVPPDTEGTLEVKLIVLRSMRQRKLGEALNAARLEKQMSLRKLAKLAGISAMFISEIERAIKAPKLATAISLEDALGIKRNSIAQYL